jgi:hypothetical protein
MQWMQTMNSLPSIAAHELELIAGGYRLGANEYIGAPHSAQSRYVTTIGPAVIQRIQSVNGVPHIVTVPNPFTVYRN